ncbi:MAG: hypothetical protein ACOYJ1_10450 [Peptococcales bacterium]|jgi:hypothetical protein
MEKFLEKVYKEEYVKCKARFDYEKVLVEKNIPKKKKEQYIRATGQIMWGIAVLVLLYRIYQLF